MKFTEEEIKNFKNDPFVKMLIHFAGPEAFDTAIAEAEKEITKQESEKSSEREEYVNETMNDKEFFALIDDLEFVASEENKLNDLGINISNIAMVQKLWNIVYDLLTYIFNNRAADEIIDNIYCNSVNKEALWKIANE